MKLCLNGVTRIVLLVGPFAIKIPRINYGWQNFLRGLLCNMQERAFAAVGWDELCPIHFSIPGGWMIVMARAEPIPEDVWQDFDYEQFSGFRSWSEQRVVAGHYCNRRYVPVENKIDSFGIYAGRIVAVDYGS